MIDAVLNFCVYGTMLEDHFGFKQRDLLTQEEVVKLPIIIDRELKKYGEENVVTVYRERFREAVNAMLSETK